MLLVMVAGWIDHEANPALAALNNDLHGASDDEAEAAAKEGPERLAAAMIDLLDTVGTISGLGPNDWRRVRRLAGGWPTKK